MPHQYQAGKGRAEVNEFFDRAERTARDAMDFPAMNVPVAAPILKVFILEGLNASNEAKYGSSVTSHEF